MKITRSQLGQIIREEATRLAEAGKPLNKLKSPGLAIQRANKRARLAAADSANDDLGSYEAVEIMRKLDAAKVLLKDASELAGAATSIVNMIEDAYSAVWKACDVMRNEYLRGDEIEPPSRPNKTRKGR